MRPAGGTDKTGGRVPLGLNHAPANGTNYRIFHGIRYLKCVVRAVRAAAGQPLLYVPPASVLRIYRRVSDTKRLLRNRSFSDNHSRLFLSAPPSSDTPTAQAVVAVRSRPDAENRSHMLRIFPRLSAGCSRGAAGHTSRQVSEQYRVASATRRSCAGRLSAVGGGGADRKKQSKHPVSGRNHGAAEDWCYSARKLICVSPAVCDFVKSRSARRCRRHAPLIRSTTLPRAKSDRYPVPCQRCVSPLRQGCSGWGASLRVGCPGWRAGYLPRWVGKHRARRGERQ